jgi:TRAP-type uncharacterized transport system substrate-binding protein
LPKARRVPVTEEERVRNLKRFFPLLAVVVLAVAATPWLIGRPCPRHVVIATGSTDGNYYALAKRYRDILARDGVTLEVRSTAGSVENRQLLADDGEVSLAIIQGGVAGTDTDGKIESLASLYLEPVWVFHRGDLQVEHLTDLRGKRIAVDRPGSGTRALALLLLQENDVAAGPASGNPGGADLEPAGPAGNLPPQSARRKKEPQPTARMEPGSGSVTTSLVALGGSRAAEALQAGEIDAAFFVISPQSPIVRELLRDDQIRLMSFRRAAAYQRQHPFLSSVTLSEGMLDLQSNVPSRDIVLLAPAANLVTRSDLHDALVPLVLDAATEVHQQDGFLGERGTFPTLRYAECPVNDKARRYFKSGPPLFFRILPFRVVVWLDQMKLVALPLFTLLLPLLKVAPPVYRWRIRSKIYRWYRILREIDLKLNQADAGADFADDVARLRNLDEELSEVSVPLSYMEEFYNLRLHVAYLLEKVVRKQQQRSPLQLQRAA